MFQTQILGNLSKMSDASTCSCIHQSCIFNGTICKECGLPVLIQFDESSKQIEETEPIDEIEQKLREHCITCTSQNCRIDVDQYTIDQLRAIKECQNEPGDLERIYEIFVQRYGNEPDSILWEFATQPKFRCKKYITISSKLNNVFGKRFKRIDGSAMLKVRHNLINFIDESQIPIEKQEWLVALAYHYTVQYIKKNNEYNDTVQESHNLSKVVSILSQYQITRSFQNQTIEVITDNATEKKETDSSTEKYLSLPQLNILAKIESPYALLLYDKLNGKICDSETEYEIWKRLKDQMHLLRKYTHGEVYQCIKYQMNAINDGESADSKLFREMIAFKK